MALLAVRASGPRRIRQLAARSRGVSVTIAVKPSTNSSTSATRFSTSSAWLRTSSSGERLLKIGRAHV